MLAIRAVVDKLVLKLCNLDECRASGSLTELTEPFSSEISRCEG